MNNLKTGDVCSITVKGKRIDCAIASTCLIQQYKTGMVEYTLAPIEPQGKTYSWKASEAHLELPGKRYSKEQIEAAIDRANTQQKTIPCAVTDEMLEKMCTEGWYQITAGAEFMSTIFVVAFTKELACKGPKFIYSGNTIYMDPELEVYWRDASCFD